MTASKPKPPLKLVYSSKKKHTETVLKRLVIKTASNYLLSFPHSRELTRNEFMGLLNCLLSLSEKAGERS